MPDINRIIAITEQEKLYGKEVMDYTPSEYEPNKSSELARGWSPGWSTPNFNINICGRCHQAAAFCACTQRNESLPPEYVKALKNASMQPNQTDVYALTGCAPSTPTQPTTKAVKFDEGKLRFDLIPPEFLEELARVYTIGAKKYGDNNYLNGGMDWSRVIAALKRHLNSWEKGEIHDPVDKQEHLASVAWCAGALMMYQHHNLGKDDRVATYLKAKK